ncbi:hypothetical protein RRF57_002958 [Xylaria bambusicola]|uniref:Uncharacterized protein n=1 Tax=Xylaria bambusicola TaxID=326684 RepID=A0AAN7UFC7_9PEZI
MVSELTVDSTCVGLSVATCREPGRFCMIISFSEVVGADIDVVARLLDVRGWTIGRAFKLSAMDGALPSGLAGDDGRDPLGGQGNVIVANIFGKPGDSGGISSFGTAKLG